MDYINEMNNLVQNLEVFENEEFGPVRATTINNEPWFVGKDIASILGYAKPQNAIANHVDEDDTLKQGIIDKLGRSQQTTLINESGLYSLILSSKLPNAKKFKRWVTSDVLPSIRKTGGYIPHDENMSDDEIMARALLVAQKTIEEKSKLLQQAKETIEDMKPKALVGECLEVSKDSILVRELAKILKQNGIDIGQNRLFEWLRDNGYLIKTGSDKNMPTQRAMNMKLFEVKHTNMICNGETKIRKTTMVTGKGINYFINKFVSLEVI
jgi:anti-repressor protein|nr:MAG TPA: repressor domain protein [Caudoviricetes sp.]DAZ68172.1 MAG TPA: repressor domain protein [Caudoviricetes sp.]